MKPDYQDILERFLRNRSRYTDFLKRLKNSRNGKYPLDVLFKDAHEASFAVIDCTVCSRCCEVLGPRIRNEDISRLAGRTRVKSGSFVDTYLKTDEDGDLVFKSMPCPYLGGDGYCLVYEDRPRSCRDYPHLNNGRQSNMLKIHMENLKYCPAVVLALEKLMLEISL